MGVSFVRIVITALAVSLTSAVALAGPIGAKKKVVVEGWADMAGSKATAREAAIADGQKRAIEQTAGVHIKSMMSDESLAVIKNDESKFKQEVSSKVYTKSKGFIHGYKILKEGATKDGKTYKVKLQVEVDDVAVSRELAILAKHMAGARFPKIMFIVDEQYTNKAGAVEVVQEPTLQAILEDTLLAKGFDLVAQEQIDKLRSQEAQVFDDIVTDDNKAAKFAMEYGAEYLVKAVGRVKYTSFNDLRQQEYHGFAELSLKAINASSAAVVASNKESGNSPANAFSEVELRVKAIRHVAPKLVDNLLKRTLESWNKETANGIRYSVKLYNVKSYRKEGRAFIKLLEKLPEAKNVKKLSYGGDRLEIEIFYPMRHDLSHLEDAIMDATDGQKAFRKMDVTYSRGRELNFKL